LNACWQFGKVKKNYAKGRRTIFLSIFMFLQKLSRFFLTPLALAKIKIKHCLGAGICSIGIMDKVAIGLLIFLGSGSIKPEILIPSFLKRL
jgi:hypothetical protein